MPSYRQIQNGFISLEVNDMDLAIIVRNLKSFLRSSHNFGVKSDPLVIGDLVKQLRLLTGGDFRAFLIANYGDGYGPIASLVRDIILYMNGKISYRSVITAITIEQNRVRTYNNIPGGWQNNVMSKNRLDVNGIADLTKVTDFDFFYLLSAVAPENVISMFLSLAGETADVDR